MSVVNQSSAAILFDTDIRFLDEAGAEVWSEYVVESVLLGSATTSIHGTFDLPQADADRIKNMRTILQPADEVSAKDYE